PVDLLGTAIAAAAIVALALAFSLGGAVRPWTSPLVLGLLVAAVALRLALVAIERRAADPVIPLDLLRHRAAAGSALLAFVGGALLFASLAYLPLFELAADQSGPVVIGLRLSGMLAALMLATFAGRELLRRGAGYRRPAVSGLTVTALSLVLLS